MIVSSPAIEWVRIVAERLGRLARIGGRQQLDIK